MQMPLIEVLKQPNGKYASYDSKKEEFGPANFETPEALKAFFLAWLDRIISEQIHYADNPDKFDMYAELYKIKYGLVDDEKEDARATLQAMGVSV
jgi:hypothetical protein